MDNINMYGIKKEFLEIYQKVFDENNITKNCGRELCSQLIECAQNVDETINFGNPDTGIMNIPNLRILRLKILLE